MLRRERVSEVVKGYVSKSDGTFYYKLDLICLLLFFITVLKRRGGVILEICEKQWNLKQGL
uniref:Uncharacterized protein n=1 Tax=Bartonella schoenbuchensis TaxID=165694 RepID=A0A024LPQ3_9HYPH|nr:hypothetical protein BN1046_00336 [Bartonella schoenbuchensis]